MRKLKFAALLGSVVVLFSFYERMFVEFHSWKPAILPLNGYNWCENDSLNCVDFWFVYGLYEADLFDADDVIVESQYHLVVRDVAENEFELNAICMSFQYIDGANYRVDIEDIDSDRKNQFSLKHTITSQPTSNVILEENTVRQWRTQFESNGMRMFKNIRFEVVKDEGGKINLVYNGRGNLGKKDFPYVSFGTSIRESLKVENEFFYDTYLYVNLVRLSY